MAVDDYGIEVLKKSGEYVVCTDKSNQYLKVSDISGSDVATNDIDFTNSDNGDFTGQIASYFDDLQSINCNTTSDNPKTIKIWFNKTIYASDIALGCNDLDESFSNVKLELFGSGEVTRLIVDDSSNDTKLNSKLYEFAPTAFNGFRIEFHTSDDVCISNIAIRKESRTVSQIKAIQDDGTTIDIAATNRGNFKVAIQEYGDTPSIDSFSRLRVSNPFTLFDSKQLHDKRDLFWDEEIGGDATSEHNEVDSDVKMTVTANADDYVIRQTKQRFNYQPGKSMLSFITFYAPQTPGLTKRVGLFTGTGTNKLTPFNGIFFESNGDVSWNICKNGVITERVLQEGWNVDKLDGTGFSEHTLDLDAAQILVVDYEWLGVGRVRVGFIINGLIIYTHYFNHANNPLFDSVYMSTPNLPIRYSIETDGTASGTMSQICSTVMAEGGIEETGILRSVDNGTTPVSAGTAGTTYVVKAIRLKDAYLDVSVLPEFFSMMNTESDNFRWSLQLNPELDTPLTYTDVLNSAVQEASGTGEIVTTPGLKIDSGYVFATGTGANAGGFSNRKFVTSLRIGSTIAEVRDELVLCVTPLTGGAQIYGGLTFRELL